MARAVSSQSERDIIVARATAPGDGAIAIVRASGPDLGALRSRVFAGDGESRVDPGRLVLGRLRSADGAAIDECLAVLWKSPRSYTGEDVLELHLHGSEAVVRQAIDACLAAGARIARPGEFTRRAFLNGRMDLVQAEAVCDLVRAHTDAAGRAALRQLDGGLSRILVAARERLVPVVAELEARIDFPEEGLEFETRGRLARELDAALADLRTLLDSSQRGKLLRDGARIVLAGPPNAGKSSLFNALLRRERALVTPHAGTTRDTIEAEIDLAGIPATLVDTAGLRDSPEEIEALGIDRARTELTGADLVLYVVDPGRPAEAAREYDAVRPLAHLVVLNKCDAVAGAAPPLPPALAALPGVRISATTREGLDALEREMVRRLGGASSGEAAIVTNRRHAEALRESIDALQTAMEALASEMSPEFIVVDLVEAIAALDRITGRTALDEDVLDAIFGKFCLGK